jgi:hypothetical protein
MARAARSSATKRGIESGKREKAARKAEKRKAAEPKKATPPPPAK